MKGVLPIVGLKDEWKTVLNRRFYMSSLQPDVVDL